MVFTITKLGQVLQECNIAQFVIRSRLLAYLWRSQCMVEESHQSPFGRSFHCLNSLVVCFYPVPPSHLELICLNQNCMLHSRGMGHHTITWAMTLLFITTRNWLVDKLFMSTPHQCLTEIPSQRSRMKTEEENVLFLSAFAFYW